MRHVAGLPLRLYPAEHHAEFGDEMLDVFHGVTAARPMGRELGGLLQGLVRERCRQLMRDAPPAASLVAGSVFAGGVHWLAYWFPIPGKAKGLRLFPPILVAFIGFAQQPPRQDPATLELAKSIYTRAFTELRAAKTLEDMKRLADRLDSPEWISVDRFGRTALKRQDADRLMVLASMMPHQAALVDGEGKHRAMEGTLVRDLFLQTADGWRRVQHDKLVPNSMVLAVDGVPRIVPPLDEPHRVTLAP
jgi:hypothetical protein